MIIEHVLKLMEREPVTSKAELSRTLNISAQSLSNWFSRNNIPDKYSLDIAKYFSDRFNELITVEHLKGIKSMSEKPVRQVPIIGTTSCGSADTNHLQDENKQANYNGEFWSKDLYCVIANGDSMAPDIDDGDEIIIDPNIKPQHGDMVHYKLDGESAVKVLVIDEDAYIMQFVPYNQSEAFKTKTIRLDDEDTLEKLEYHKVVSVNKLKYNNRLARLKMIGRA